MRNDQTDVSAVGVIGGLIDQENPLKTTSQVVGTGMFIEQKQLDRTVYDLNRQIKSRLGYSIKECQDQQACYWKK